MFLDLGISSAQREAFFFGPIPRNYVTYKRSDEIMASIIFLGPLMSLVFDSLEEKQTKCRVFIRLQKNDDQIPLLKNQFITNQWFQTEGLSQGGIANIIWMPFDNIYVVQTRVIRVSMGNVVRLKVP